MELLWDVTDDLFTLVVFEHGFRLFRKYRNTRHKQLCSICKGGTENEDLLKVYYNISVPQIFINANAMF